MVKYKVSRQYVEQPCEYKLIPLTKGQYAKVDNSDFERLSQFNWCACKKRNNFYAARRARVNGKSVFVQMSNEVLEITPGIIVDHVTTGETLDNRKSNLRKATVTENNWNVGIYKHNTSGFKGVSWQKSRSKWRSTITHLGKSVHLGLFNTPEEAATAFQTKCLELRGEFARVGA